MPDKHLFGGGGGGCALLELTGALKVISVILMRILFPL